MAKKDPFFNKPIHTLYTDEQCCQIVAMRDVKGTKEVEAHYGIPEKTQKTLNAKVKARPDLARAYWQYRSLMAQQWGGTLSETAIAVLTRIQQEVQKPQIDLATLNQLSRAFEILGDVSVSLSALAPANVIEDTPLFETIEVETSSKPLLITEAEDGVFS